MLRTECREFGSRWVVGVTASGVVENAFQVCAREPRRDLRATTADTPRVIM